jgi:hypothetical protein
VPVIASGKRGIAFRLAGNQEKGPRINLQFSRVLTISAADFSLIATGGPGSMHIPTQLDEPRKYYSRRFTLSVCALVVS